MQMTKNFESTKNCIDTCRLKPIRLAVLRPKKQSSENGPRSLSYIVGGVLHYKDERNGESILRQIISFELSQYCRSTSVFNKTFNNLIIILIHIPLCICVI